MVSSPNIKEKDLTAGSIMIFHNKDFGFLVCMITKIDGNKVYYKTHMDRHNALLSDNYTAGMFITWQHDNGWFWNLKHVI